MDVNISGGLVHLAARKRHAMRLRPILPLHLLLPVSGDVGVCVRKGKMMMNEEPVRIRNSNNFYLHQRTFLC